MMKPTRADWEKLAAKELKAEAASLNKTTAEGLEVKPLYTADDLRGC